MSAKGKWSLKIRVSALVSNVMDSLSVMLELFNFRLKSLVFTSSAKFYDLNGRACILNYRLPKTRSFSSEIRNNLFHSWGAFLPSTADDRNILQGI